MTKPINQLELVSVLSGIAIIMGNNPDVTLGALLHDSKTELIETIGGASAELDGDIFCTDDGEFDEERVGEIVAWLEHDPEEAFTAMGKAAVNGGEIELGDEFAADNPG